MSPESTPLATYQNAFAGRIRNPRGAPRPEGVPAARMRVYEQLLYNNLEGFLLACYPVTRKLLGSRQWKSTVQRFFSEYRCHSPLFRDIPRSFLDWMAASAADLFTEMPFLAELMHYEWLELAVSVAPDENDVTGIDPEGDLLFGRPALASSTRIAIYRYPVHQIGPRWKPSAPEGGRYAYLLYRDKEDVVRFILLNPLMAQLLDLIREHRPTGREALRVLAEAFETKQPAAFIQAGADLLNQLRTQGALAGTWKPS